MNADPQMPLMTGLEDKLLRYFGYPTFKPGQKELVQAIMNGHDALGVMPTGGGKSLCFQLPAVLLEGTALVISPLIALMKDQVDALRVRGIHAEAYHSTLNAAERRRCWETVRSGRVKLLYIAPERMQADGFMDLLSQIPISLLTIDEAHCISHWGHDFRPDYRRLGELRRNLTQSGRQRQLPVIALTATATQRVQADIIQGLHMRSPIQVITGFRRINLAFEVLQCSGRAEKLRALRQLLETEIGTQGTAIIYAATRKNVEAVAEELTRELARSPISSGLGAGSVAFYHAGVTDQERSTTQDGFLSGKTRILVATNAFGMGIDKPDVRLVVHYDIPGSVEAYYQEAGRAGRDGLPARCSLLFNYADVATQDYFIQKTGGETENQRALLKQLVRYAYASTCRQKMILGYFGDPEARALQGCGNCDCCKPMESKLVPVDEWTSMASYQVLSTAARLNGRFGKLRLCEVLKGSQTKSLLQFGLQNEPGYGLLSAWTMQAIRELVDLLIESKYLKISGLDYPLIAMTPLGQVASKGEAPILLTRSFGGSPSPKSQEEHRSTPLKERSAGDPDPGILISLKDFRSSEARRQQKPAYVIFHDKTLNELAARKPRDLQELEGISGFGPKKLELYGEKILSLIQLRQSG